MTVSTTVRRPSQRQRRSLLGVAAAAAVAAAVASALSFGGNGSETVWDGAASRAAVLSSLEPNERRYVEWIVAATPEQLAAAMGTTRPAKAPSPTKWGANTR